MSDLSRAAKVSIDYKVYHRTGKKELKPRSKSVDLSGIEMDQNQPREKMALDEKSVLELQVSEDLTESFLIFSLDDLETKEELTEGMEQISELGKKFRYVHVELKNLLGEIEYKEKYPNFEKKCSDVREYIKKVRTKIKEVDLAEKKKVLNASEAEKAEEEGKRLKAKLSEVVKVRTSLEIEERVFGGKIDREIKNFSLENPSCIQRSLDRLELIVDDYYKLFSNVKVAYGESFETACAWKQNFADNTAKLDEKIRLGKAKLIELENAARELDLTGVRGFRAPRIMPVTGGGGPVRVWGRKLPIEP